MLFRKTAYANSGELILSWSLESMEICIAQCVEVFFCSVQEGSGSLGFCPGFSLYETHQHEWLGTPKSKPVSVDDSLAKGGIPRAECSISKIIWIKRNEETNFSTMRIEHWGWETQTLCWEQTLLFCFRFLNSKEGDLDLPLSLFLMW